MSYELELPPRPLALPLVVLAAVPALAPPLDVVAPVIEAPDVAMQVPHATGQDVRKPLWLPVLANMSLQDVICPLAIWLEMTEHVMVMLALAA